ncbi:hypothetical protein PENSPDRAFT_588293 [Peniophora sp. CONT]|nr:hypothetical protein PENSPDRAFT_588293 [Peniophora sp. CONT]
MEEAHFATDYGQPDLYAAPQDQYGQEYYQQVVPTQAGQPVQKVNVTTSATAEASFRRRTNDAKFACPVPGCGSTFTRHFNLKGHMRSHNDEKPFTCKWPGCNKGFARQHDCKRHEQLHSNHRPFTCEGCHKPFARLDALNRHRTLIFSTTVPVEMLIITQLNPKVVLVASRRMSRRRQQQLRLAIHWFRPRRRAIPRPHGNRSAVG